MTDIAKLLVNLNRYEFFTQILSGIFLGVLLMNCTHFELPHADAFMRFMTMWMIGFVSGRIGAVVIEPAIKKLGTWHWGWFRIAPQFATSAVCRKFRTADKEWYSTLLADANLYRTLLAGGFVVLGVKICEIYYFAEPVCTLSIIGPLAWIMLFYNAYWRQVNFFVGYANASEGANS